MLLALDTLSEGLGQPRFPNPRVGRDQHHTSRTRLRVHPTMRQQLDFLLASDERGQLGCVQRLEPALHEAWPEHLIRAHSLSETLQLDGAKFAVFEQITDEPPGSRVDDDRVGFGEALQPRGEIGGLAGDIPFLCLADARKAADNNQTGTNAARISSRSRVWR
jgi:hypothetical protein